MKEMIKTLYEVSGSYSKRITKMLIFDVIKSIFEGISLSAILFCLMKISHNVFENQSIVMADIYLVFFIAASSMIGKIIFGYLADKNKYIASYSLGAENRLYIGDRLKKVNMGYFSHHSLGDVSGGLSTVIGDLETVGVVIVEQMLVGTIQTIIMVIVILPYDIITAMIILLTLLVAIFVNVLTQKKVDQLTGKLMKLKLNLSEKMLEYVKGIGVTKAFGKDQNTVKELKTSISNSREGFLAVEKILVPTQFSFLLVFKIGICVIISSSLMRYFSGTIDATKTIMMVVISFVVFSGFELAGSMQSIKGVAVQNLKRIVDLRNLPTIKEGQETEIKEATIKLSNISFAYDKVDLFRDLSLVIPQGKTTALVGFSGSGKTTLSNLMARFWDVTSGEVLISNTNVKDYQYDYLLSQFSFVFQDVYLFDDTIKNNITFGNPSASDEEIIEIANKAQCHDFIMALPDGYNTVLQEGGSNLSGGERQRISIARAMLKPSQFVILDEATSSIDPENEKQLLLALKNLLKDKTTIIIAHKLSTIKNADQIVVLNEGKIEQIGSHEELEKVPGIYSEFLASKKSLEKWSV
ncbi:ABC transporter ATP-binding protein [Streptococcus sp. CSL10205-OR2]|uniref:ABC transporter ATP-binding protein n=1 Tax=Streptococcus sp. CSL10205-OR2 TaxID=2980558 RepID=UPI0021D80498|nr:ABC transporter ATP-binding protein [Streptococcus sp. CSL10205-OR2]MCU9533679.1 ABC transporter ATP-binding protein/permease [Streptococcus sp. CSL10205-OR2]